jgi:hypothetical protein
MGSDPIDSLGIWFLKAEGKDQKDKIGKQTGGQPTLVIYTTSLQELYEQLVQNEVKIKVEPVITPGHSFLHCFDLYGNEIVVVELAG